MVTGAWYSSLYLGMRKAELRRRKVRVIAGNERSQKVRKVRVQYGSCGWRVAQLRDVMRGCAGAVRGPMLLSDGGSVSSLFGKSVGEIYGL